MKKEEYKEAVLDLIYQELESELQVMEESENRYQITKLIAMYKHTAKTSFDKLVYKVTFDRLLDTYNYKGER